MYQTLAPTYYTYGEMTPSEPQHTTPVAWYAALGFTAAAMLALGVTMGQGSAAVVHFFPAPAAVRAGFTSVAQSRRAPTALGVMVDATEFRKGLTVEMDGAPFKVMEFQHSKQARQAAVIRTKLQNMLTGNTLERTFRSGEKFPKAEIEYSEVQYTYKDGDAYCFTNMETFVEERLPAALLGEKIDYLQEGLMVKVAKFNGKTIDMELPASLDLRVVDTEPGEQGDRINAGTKPATVEGGRVIQVPLFVNVGDMVRVDTREDRYVTRVK